MMKNKFDWKNLVIGLLVVVTLALLFTRPTAQPDGHDHNHGDGAAPAQDTIWTCSMDPQVRVREPGLCPVCGMDLIPLETEDDSEGGWALTLSESARALAEIRTAPASRSATPHLVRMVGKVTADEKRVGTIAARVAGRIDRLFVDFTGIAVSQGDHMVEVYSPELFATQQELLSARAASQKEGALRNAGLRRLDAAREKLRLLGLTRDQIGQIEEQGKPQENLTINAPMGGIVTTKHLNEGAYVQVGTPIYTITDLSRVWVQLEAYESDLVWLRYGQEVSFEVKAYPGEVFTGRIVFIDPVLKPDTRTVSVRMDIPNPRGRLKPDMFVRARVNALLSPGGKVLDPELSGKWMCRMHPEVVADEAGSCSVCGMDLETVDALGFSVAQGEGDPLLIPESAPLITGERAVVYVETNPGRYEGRQVLLGPRTGDAYVVREGLAEGEMVVVNGSFKIDSELQIRAKNSMMYLPEEPQDTPPAVVARPTQTVPEMTQKQIGDLLTPYFAMQQALSQDNLAGAQAQVGAAKDLAKIIEARELVAALVTLGDAGDISDARAAYETFSNFMIAAVEAKGAPQGSTVLRFNCPMAFDNRGGDWLQDREGVENPYYGSMMFRCGSQTDDLSAKKSEEAGISPAQIEALLKPYFAMQQALSQDNLEGAQEHAGAASDLAKVLEARELVAALITISRATDISDARAAYETFSNFMIQTIETHGAPEGATVLRFRCPMAFDNRGADWLQDREGVENPYYGSMMFRCGSQTDDLSGARP